MLNYLQRIIFFVLTLTSASVAWAQCGCEEIEVRFRGYNCAGNGGFTISLNGESASGSGDSCGGYFGTTWATTDLALNTSYTVTSTNSCSHHVDLDIPECFDLYVDGTKTDSMSLDASSSGENGGDESWDIELRLKNSSSGSPGGSGGAPTGGSFRWEVSMGTLSDGSSAGNLFIYGEVLDSDFYDPASLQLSADADLLSVVYESNGTTLRQVISEEVIADIIDLGAIGYEIRFYDLNQMAVQVGQLVQVTGDPRVVWRLENPDTSGTTANRLNIKELKDGEEVVHRIETDATTNEVTIFEYNDLCGVSFAEEIDSTTGDTIKTEETLDGAGNVVWTVVRRYRDFPWGEELVEEIAEPNGINEITSYTYYELNPTFGSYGQLRTVSYPDGSWIRYDYNSSGRVSRIYRPWLDLPASAEDATDKNCAVTFNQYTSNGLFYTVLSSVEEKVLDNTVSLVRYQRSRISLNGEPAEKVVTSRYLETGKKLDSTQIRYRSIASDHLSGRTASTITPEGIVWTYEYEQGTWDAQNEVFTAGSGDALRTIKTQSTVEYPNGIAGQTIREIRVRNEARRQVFFVKEAYNGSEYVPFSETLSEYDTYGNLVEQRVNGRIVHEAIYDSNQLQSRVDEYGIKTTYTYYSTGRVETETRVGVASEPDVVITYGYNENGSITSRVRSAGGLEESESYTYYGSGRIEMFTDSEGRTTTYIYTNGGRTETRTEPGGVTIVSDRYKDGQLKSNTGSGVIPTFYEYSVDESGFRSTLVRHGAVDSPRWISVTRNWINRQVREEKPAFDGTTSVSHRLYNSKGQLLKQTNIGTAPTLYTYNALGRTVFSGLDVDLNGILEPASSDRIRYRESAYEINGNLVEQMNRQSVFRKEGSAAPSLLSETRLQLTELPENVSVSSSSIDAHGVRVTTVRELDRSTKTYTNQTSSSEIGRSIEQVYVNGLLRSANTAIVFEPTTFEYDALGRQTVMTSPFTGSRTYDYNSLGQLESVENDDGVVEERYVYFPTTHANAGEISQIIDAADKTTHYLYSERGQLTHRWGLNAYPIQYEYNEYGQQSGVRTYRTDDVTVNWDTSTWPANSGGGDLTQWIYQPATGLLTRKEYADGNGTDYTYGSAGRMETRSWARGVDTSYEYDPQTGELLIVDYSDSTTDIEYAYNRQGQQNQVTDASGTRSIENTVYGAQSSASYTSGSLNGYEIAYGHDQYGRSDALGIKDGSQNIILDHGIEYDSASRIKTISSANLAVDHSYHPAGEVLRQLRYLESGTETFRRDVSFDSLGRLDSIMHGNAGNDVIANFTYQHDSLNRREQITVKDGDYWSYGYNDRFEVTQGSRYLADATLQAGLQFEYEYDTIGNRLKMREGGDASGANLRETVYTPDALNQYDAVANHGYLQVVGQANAAATVTVNTQSTDRQDVYFRGELAVDNSTGPVYESIDVDGTRSGHTPLEETGHLFVPAQTVSPTYDLDGNLKTDARWSYTWNAENRLVEMETLPVAYNAGAPRQRLQFAYDSEGRRFSKKVYDWDSGSGAYMVSSQRLFLYDGWNMVAELDDAVAPIATISTYLWGLDLSNSPQGAGGVGGLLAVTDESTSATYYPYNDGNGNVMGYYDQSQSNLAAEFEYGPFGELVRATGSKAEEFSFSFSTKYQDAETGLLYYGFRYYDPVTGRWPSRDPIEELGGLNLFAMTENDLVNQLDFLGALTFKFAAFIPKNLGTSVINSPVADVNWAPEPNPISSWWFSTDNRSDPGSSGTSRVYSTSINISASDVGSLEGSGSVFTTESNASHRIKVVRKGTGRRNRPPYTYTFRGGDDDFEEETAGSSDEEETEDIGPCYSKVTLEAAGSYPWGGPNINYNVTLHLRTEFDHEGRALNDGEIELTIEGSHNEFPAYEAMVNGSSSTLYEDLPTASGPGLFNLGVFWDNFGPISEVY